jgi:hypothetical protein
MFPYKPSRAIQIRTIVLRKAANDNAPARRNYFGRLAEKSRETRQFLRRAEQHLREIRTLLLGHRPGSGNRDG